MNKAKSYTIRILNDQFTIESDDSEELVFSAAQRVDTCMREIIEHNKSIDHKKIALVVALRLASQLIHLESELKGIQHIEQKLAEVVSSMNF
jgi:cell division protein ZapA (FtsZ GTPase activity inhibitor)